MKDKSLIGILFAKFMQKVRKVALFIRYLTELRKIRATYFSGNLSGSDTKIKALFLGSFNWVSEVFFDGEAQAEDLGLVNVFFQNRVRSRLAEPDTDIVITTHLPWSWRRKGHYIVPAFLEAELSLPGTIDEFMAGLRSKYRYKIKQALKMGLDFELGESEADYRAFYEQMLIPLIKYRHGSNAHLISFEDLYSKVSSASLIFVKQGEKRLGGVQIIWPTASKPYAYFNKVGMLDEVNQDNKLFNQVNMALYYQMCNSTIQRGVSCLNLGIVPPTLNNGLIRFKGSWGTNFSASSDYQRYEVTFCSKNQQEILEHCHLIHLEDKQLVATVGMNKHMLTEPDALEKVKGKLPSGLSRIDVIASER
jgi:hypothetical protein